MPRGWASLPVIYWKIILPTDWTVAGWTKAWSEACTGVQCEGVRGFFWNSSKMTVLAVLISPLLGAFNGYVLSKWTFKGSDLMFGMLLFGAVFASGDSQPITVALNNLVNTSTGVKEYNVDMAAAMIAALMFDMRKVVFFDPESEKRIRPQ